MAPVTGATACRDTAVLQCHTSHQHKDRSIINVINSDADLTFSRNQLEKLEAAKAARLVCLSLLSLTYWVLLGPSGPYWALLGLT